MQVLLWLVATGVVLLSVIVTAVTTFVDQPNRLTILPTDLPSLQLHVILKRASMQIHGHVEFDVFIKPVVSADDTRVHYNGFVNFSQNATTTVTYLLVDGAGYVVERSSSGGTLHCLQSTVVHDSIVSVLNKASQFANTTASDVDIECSKENLFKTSFNGSDFILCAAGSSGFASVSNDMEIEVKYLNTPIHSVSVPSLSDADCGSITTGAASLTPTSLAILTGRPTTSTMPRNLKTADHMASAASSCECKSTPRPCVFFHGIGNPIELNELQDTPDATNGKVGDIGDHAPCCTTIKYAVLNTVDNGWTDDALQEKFCRHALSLSETSDQTSHTIKDTIVVTHSMGGLVMASALATGKCSFSTSTSWVAISTPMRGSMAVDYLQGICKEESGTFAMDVLEFFGRCPVYPARKTVAYQDGKYSTPDLNAAYAAAQEAYRGNVTAAMCSKHYVGVVSKYLAKNVMLGTWLPHKSSANDGLVEFQSCAAGLDSSLFGNNYLDRFYSPDLNHRDTAFLTHDGWFKDSQKPFKWLECLL